MIGDGRGLSGLSNLRTGQVGASTALRADQAEGNSRQTSDADTPMEVDATLATAGETP